MLGKAWGREPGKNTRYQEGGYNGAIKNMTTVQWTLVMNQYPMLVTPVDFLPMR